MWAANVRKAGGFRLPPLRLPLPFPQEEELAEKSARLNELNILLNLEQPENEILDGDVPEEDEMPARQTEERER